jgi:membrane-bound serine protease (ClpP class)
LSLVVVAVAALAVDVQTGVPRFWTAIGTVTLVAGSLLLFTDGVSVGWLPLVVGVGGTLLLLVSATPAVVRSRFSTPTIGRDWMVGELVTTESVVDPDGTVLLRDARWRARTNRATPIAAGAPARVTGIDGVVLEVEPLEGAARDYRERGTPR